MTSFDRKKLAISYYEVHSMLYDYVMLISFSGVLV